MNDHQWVSERVLKWFRKAADQGYREEKDALLRIEIVTASGEFPGKLPIVAMILAIGGTSVFSIGFTEWTAT